MNADRPSRWDILSITVGATALVPPVAMLLFWLIDTPLHWLLGVRPNPNNWSASPLEMLNPVYLGLGPPAAVTGAAIGAWRARTGQVSLVAAVLAGLAAGTVQLLILMTLWPDTEPPEMPFRAMEIALVADLALVGALFAALVRAIDRSRLTRREL